MGLSTWVRIFSPQLCETGKKERQKKRKCEEKKKGNTGRTLPGEATRTFPFITRFSILLVLFYFYSSRVLHPMVPAVYNGRLRYPPSSPVPGVLGLGGVVWSVCAV